MFISVAECGPLAANCYLVGADDGDECVIIDPGMEAVEPVTSMVKKHGRQPVAILVTHGHFDHVADAAPLAARYEIPVWVHSGDQHLLSNPAAGVSPDFADWLATFLPDGLVTPATVLTLDDQTLLELAGLKIQIIPAPGHTRGSTLYRVDDGDDTAVFTGDVLFAGSIGRTDMPGGNSQVMGLTLRGPVLGLPDNARILSGHGPASTMARERRSNPYLRPGLFL